MEQLERVEASSAQVEEMVQALLGTRLNALDQYMEQVRICFSNGDELLDDALNKISLQLPTYLYDLVLFAQQLEMKKGVANETSKYAKNEALLNASGTVVDKTAKAENSTIQDRINELAYKTAAAIVQKKLDGVMTMLDSVKKVRQAREKERTLTNLAGSSVASF